MLVRCDNFFSEIQAFYFRMLPNFLVNTVLRRNFWVTISCATSSNHADTLMLSVLYYHCKKCKERRRYVHMCVWVWCMHFLSDKAPCRGGKSNLVQEMHLASLQLHFGYFCMLKEAFPGPDGGTSQTPREEDRGGSKRSWAQPAYLHQIQKGGRDQEPATRRHIKAGCVPCAVPLPCHGGTILSGTDPEGQPGCLQVNPSLDGREPTLNSISSSP